MNCNAFVKNCGYNYYTDIGQTFNKLNFILQPQITLKLSCTNCD